MFNRATIIHDANFTVWTLDGFLASPSAVFGPNGCVFGIVSMILKNASFQKIKVFIKFP